MDAGINNVIYMELNSGPKIANSTCGKTIVAGTIDRGSTVFIKIYSYTTHIQIFKITSFGFVNKSLLDFFFIRTIQRNLSLHVGLRYNSFTYVTKFIKVNSHLYLIPHTHTHQTSISKRLRNIDLPQTQRCGKNISII